MNQSILAGDIVHVDVNGQIKRVRVYSLPQPWNTAESYTAFVLMEGEKSRPLRHGQDELVFFRPDQVVSKDS